MAARADSELEIRPVLLSLFFTRVRVALVCCLGWLVKEDTDCTINPHISEYL